MDRPSFKRKSDNRDEGSRKAAKTAGPSGGASGGKMSFAQKMMAKMGYKEGEGLGKTGEGILNPIEVKLRPQGVGVGAVKEKTDQAKQEARRQAALRGEEYEDSSEEERKARKKRKDAARSTAGSGASTPGGFTRPKVKYRTVADIEAATEGLEVPNVLKSLIDATGKEKKLLTSAAGLMTPTPGTPSADTGTEKIAKRAQLELTSYADSWNDLLERQKIADLQQQQLQQEIDEEQEIIRKLQSVTNEVASLNLLDLNKPSTADRARERWEDVVSRLETLQVEYRDDIETLGLSGVAVAAIHPLFKQEMFDWDPLAMPTHLVPYLQRLRTILRISKNELISANGYDDFDHPRRHKSTTPYETMIYKLWLPKVRTAVTNDWDPRSPSELLTLIESWSDLLPAFVHYNLLNNLIAQKLSATLQTWNPRPASKKRHSQPLPHTWLFPWLHHLAPYHVDPTSSTGLLTDVKRKMRVALDSWDLKAGVMPGLSAWREVMRSSLDDALIRHLLPRLARLLQTDFKVDPADQDLTALENVLAWKEHFKAPVMGQLLVAEFFPNWLNTLHFWLTSEPKYDEVGEWFTWWKEQIPADINAVKAVAESWEKGLEMINRALDLGAAAKTDLPLPSAGPAKPVGLGTPKAKTTKEPGSSRKIVEEATFKDVVEAWCAQESLLMMPLREAHDQTGSPLFRITASASGRGGAIAYIRGDTVWVQSKKDRGLWGPMGLDDELVARAEGK